MISTPFLDTHSVSKFSQINIDFNPIYQSLTIHRADVIRGRKVIPRLPGAEIRTINREKRLDDMIYEGILTASVILKDIRKGDVIDFAYTIKGRNPILGKKFDSFFNMGWLTDIDKARIRINIPKSRTLRYRTILSDIKPVISLKGNIRTYEWLMANPPPAKYEYNTPSWIVQSPMLQVSEYKNWKEVAGWALELFSAGRLPDSLRPLTDRWKKQSRSKQLLSALDFVQDEIRYLGMEIGENSHKPHKPLEVLRNRYGDCKDKALFLSVLLGSLKYKATPVLVSATNRKAIGRWLPGTQMFDHVIVKIETDEGIFWVDPTITDQAGGLRHRYISKYGYGLVIDRGQKKLVKIPDNSQKNIIKMVESYDIKKREDPVILKVHTDYFGPVGDSRKRELKNWKKSGVKDKYYSYYKELYEKVNPEFQFKVLRNKNAPAIKTREQYKIEDPWVESDDHLSLKTYAEVMYSYISDRPNKDRTKPFLIYHPVKIHYRGEISLPKGSVVDLYDLRVEIKNSLHHYKRKITRDGDKVYIDHYYRSKKAFVKPEQITQYINDSKRIEKSLTYWIPLQKTSYIRLKTRMDNLRDLLKDDEM